MSQVIVVNAEIIRETAWNLCKLFDATRQQRRRDKVLLANFVSTKLEQRFGTAVENLFRAESQDEVSIFCQKYGYSSSGSGQAGEGQSTQESPRLIQWSFTVECPRCSKLFEVPHLALEVLATGAELGECAGCGCPITVSLHSHSTDERR